MISEPASQELPEGIRRAIQALEAQRELLGDKVVNQMIRALLASYQAALSQQVGSGGLANGDHAQAVGQQGMLVDGSVGRDALGPGAIKVDIQVGEGGADPKALRRAYLKRVMDSAGYVSLAGIDPEAASKAESRLSLGAVYTALLTDTAERIQGKDITGEWEERRLSALDMANRHSRFVLLGYPGSGKSTFVNFLALCLAGEALGDPLANLDLLTTPLPVDDNDRRRQKEPVPQSWDHGELLPVQVILRDFAARGLPEFGALATASHLWEFIAAELKAHSLDAYAPFLHKELLDKGGLLMLDGLDEVPEAGKRRLQLKQAVEDFATTFQNCRILVTSRTYAYERQDWKLKGFQDARLVNFNRGQIARFIDRWYEHIAPSRGLGTEDAQGRAGLLKRAVFGSDRLIGLAERPLLLTLMASLHAWRGGSLPEKREQLYADTVDLLLDWWESPKAVRDKQGQLTLAQSSLSEWLKVDRDKVRALLNELAYQAHAGQVELADTAEVSEGLLVSGLMRLSQNPELAANPVLLVDYLSQRAGLLIPKGIGVYTFPHRTFQEYLAACYLTDHGYPEMVAELACQDPNRWREVTLLAGAKAARGGAFALWSLVDSLCPQEPASGGNPPAATWGAHLAGQALVETADLERVSPPNRQKVERVQRWLVHILQLGSLNSVERARAGDNLAVLGDPRFDPDSWYLPKEPLLGFVEVPAGEFLMGSDPKKDQKSFADEKPQHRLHLPGYYLARFPVTVAQFQAFIAGSGDHPQDTDSLEGLPNHPVVNVTWYDAVAYCRWLGEKLKGEAQKRVLAGSRESFWQGLASGGLNVTLPSEAEWEKASRGTDSLIYPWGDQPDSEKANYDETGIGTTSAVGCFSGGAGPYGLLDMSGNVWEWTRSLWGEDWGTPTFGYPYTSADGREALDAPDKIQRVLRGGAFYLNDGRVRCAYRSRSYPGRRYGNYGFRVVVSPIDH